MKIELENVGKINKAQIRLDGITVIAGENSTGKSTVGKMLFCVFKAFYRMEEHIQFEKVNTALEQDFLKAISLHSSISFICPLCMQSKKPSAITKSR